MAWRNCLLLVGLCAVVVSSMDDRIMHPSIKSSGSSRSSPDEELASYWRDKAQNLLAAKLSQPVNTNVAKNVIMFLGDGMSIPTLAAARAMLGQRASESGEEAELSFEQFPYAGLSKTYCVDYQVADSACTSTAYLTGVKANEGTMGITAAVNRSDCVGQADTTQHVDSIVQWSQDAGKATGIITTARITHASPGGGYAHIADRDWESDADVFFAGGDVSVCEDIASQLVSGRTGRNVKVLMGGGRKNFLPNTTLDDEGSRGRRRDQRNLIDEWLQDKTNQGSTGTYIWNRDQLLNLDINTSDYVLGLFESDHMKYHSEADPVTEPTLAEMTEVAIKALQKEPNGFFLFVEGARIDMGHHENRAYRALDETIEMAAAVTIAKQLTSESDTLIVVTADHAHTMSYSGYPLRGTDILGLAGKGGDQYPYTTLSYANGPGFHSIQSDGSRYNLTEDDTNDPLYVFPALNPLYSETHGGDDVAILSSGPWAHMLSGVLEQNYIPHLMAYASCVGTGATVCAKKL